MVVENGVTVYGLRILGGPTRYVGQTTKSLHARIASHWNRAMSGCPYAVYNWLRKCKRLGNEVEIFTIVTNAVWDETEVQIIAEYRKAGLSLLNHTDGGRGSKGVSRSEQTKAKLSTIVTSAWSDPLHREKMRLAQVSAWTPERREAQRQRVIGRRLSQEHKDRIAESTRARYDRPEEKQAQRARLDKARAARKNFAATPEKLAVLERYRTDPRYAQKRSEASYKAWETRRRKRGVKSQE